MKKNYITIFGSMLLAAGIVSCAGNKGNESEQKAPAQPTQAELVARGEYLVTTMGCNDCHSPKQMGPAGPEIIKDRMLSGYPADRPTIQFEHELINQGFAMLYPDLTAAIGPWGTSFAANLTPDATGIGNWTEEQFKKALKEGKLKGMDGMRQLLPPMPYQNFANLSDADVSAMFAYLKSLKPVNNLVPQPIPPTAPKQ